MSRALARSLLIICLTLCVGGHWGFLQSVAWVRMTWEFSKEQPLPSAFAKALSGEAPCQICELVASGKKQETERESIKPDQRIDLLVAARSELILVEPRVKTDRPTLVFPLFRPADRPPFPPPRSA